jgi:hypothetical protein
MKIRYFLLLLLLLVSPLVVWWRWSGPILDTPKAFRGTAIGAYDRAPIAGVLVVGYWKASDTIYIEGKRTRTRYVAAGVTDAMGKFSLPPPKWGLRSPLVQYTRDPVILAFKPGFSFLTESKSDVVMWPLPSMNGAYSEPRNEREIVDVLKKETAFESPQPRLGDYEQVRSAVATYVRIHFPQ